MRPTVSEQLRGISTILTDAIHPQLVDDYTRNVLTGVADRLMTLSRTWYAIPDFLRWDSTITASILHLVGLPVPPVPDDRFDIAALEEHHRQVRERLANAMPMILADPVARKATAALFRERAARFASLGRVDD